MKPDPQDDELLRSYLLGELPDEDAEGLERRLLAEDDLFDLAEAMEVDLLAAVDRGDLAPGDRERVLRKLAATPLGRQRLALARSLNILADETAMDRTVVPFPRRAQAFPPPAIHWMALAASLVVLTGLGWFAWQHREQASKATSQVAVQAPAPTPPPPAAPRPASPPVAETPRPAAPSTAVVMISLMTTRGAETAPVEKLRLSPAIQTAEIQLDAGGLDETKSFSVVIRQGEKMVWKKSGLKITLLKWGPALVAKVSAPSLKAGKYEVAVTPDGGSEELTQIFAVVRNTM
jgi:hypothetical protein